MMSAVHQTTEGASGTQQATRAGALWQAIRQRGLMLVLAALTVFCWAAIPLYTSTERTHAEYRIVALQKQILRLQRDKSQLTQELSERLRLEVLEKAARDEGLGPPAQVDYLTVP